jgi:hypothetical protein
MGTLLVHTWRRSRPASTMPTSCPAHRRPDRHGHCARDRTGLPTTRSLRGDSEPPAPPTRPAPEGPTCHAR